MIGLFLGKNPFTGNKNDKASVSSGGLSSEMVLVSTVKVG
jgi:hypothetical protein